MPSIVIPYTLAFCISHDEVLLVRREKPPFPGCWNGLGGKIEAGESAIDSIRRELREEAWIRLSVSSNIRYKGIVAWSESDNLRWRGMHLFTLRLKRSRSRMAQTSLTDEGVLSWVPIAQLKWPLSIPAAPNLPTMLPMALDNARIRHLLYLIRRDDGGYSAAQTPLANNVPWPKEAVDPGRSWEISEIIQREVIPSFPAAPA